MKQITLRLPDELHSELKDLATREHRSLHAQVLHMLQSALDARSGEAPDARSGRPTA
ncbi:FitA-like ribbon-helix-helix domain-containing protein [Actinomadura bangladeshensis]|uniref:Arc family DNA-binding protein n=1 Tax=Actinomadura bangladeshensis TaxID=453573 RepID=A0A4R4P0E4_9ACTN|nr:Arc family DNA-binding protein [Actinomadura bangladeshensis]TDC14007.1 Arc family DNA-binding protein [Actinomadura bangladeshensis]